MVSLRMKIGEYFVLLVVFLLIVSIGSAQLSSENYNITSGTTTDGGGNVSSESYDSSLVVGIISGDVSSDNYVNQLGVFYGLNSAPNDPMVYINSSDGSNKTLQNLNCIASLNDDDGNDLSVFVRWYLNGSLNLTVNYSSQLSGSDFVGVLGAGNTTKGDVWRCGMQIYDGLEYSSWVNSSVNLTILNSLPTVTLSAPSDWNATTNRSPEFSWTSNDDDDDDSLTYEISISEHKFAGLANCNDDRSDDSLSSTSYVPSGDLLCLYDNGYYYNWSVRASDGEWGSWTNVRHLNISAEIGISLANSSVDFGSLVPGEIENSSDDSPSPFVVSNDGNVVVNISLNSSSLWNSETGTSSFYQFKADNVSGEEGAFDWLLSIVDWFDMPINGLVVAVGELNYSDGTDSAEVDIRLEVPNDEDPSAKSANIIFKGALAE